MVECEYVTKELEGRFFKVLIDTWWNVNSALLDEPLHPGCSFNRYMVECESKPGRVVPSRFSVLIDTWWNVN